MAVEPEPIEDAAAGLLTGVMVFLLGTVIPGALVWSVIANWETGFADLRSGSIAEAGQLVTLVGFSLLFMRWGAGQVWKNVRALRRRRDSAPAR